MRSSQAGSSNSSGTAVTQANGSQLLDAAAARGMHGHWDRASLSSTSASIDSIGTNASQLLDAAAARQMHDHWSSSNLSDLSTAASISSIETAQRVQTSAPPRVHNVADAGHGIPAIPISSDPGEKVDAAAESLGPTDVAVAGDAIRNPSVSSSECGCVHPYQEYLEGGGQSNTGFCVEW